jgi:DNA-directed RNA polymerase specialized sigma subunit
MDTQEGKLIQKEINKFLSKGNKPQNCPEITATNRDQVNKKLGKPKEKPEREKPNQTMNCIDCEVYLKTKGRGSKTCFNCRRYTGFKLRSEIRQSVAYECVPEDMLNKYADEKQNTILDVLRKMPPMTAIIISSHYYAHINISDLSTVMNISRRQIRTHIQAGIHHLKTHISPTEM